MSKKFIKLTFMGHEEYLVLPVNLITCVKSYKTGSKLFFIDVKEQEVDVRVEETPDEIYERLEGNGVRTESTSADGDAIKPEHYRKGEIDLYESWYLTRPFNEYRAIMESVAERYIKRDKEDRIEDLNKGIYTLERLKEKERKNG